MSKGTTSRRGRTRPATPKTIDLAVSEVKAAAAKPEPADETASEGAAKSHAATPAAEPVAFYSPEPTKPETSGSGGARAGTGTAGQDDPAKASGAGNSDSRKPSFGRGSETGADGGRPPAPARSGGMMNSLVAGLVGAVLALVLLGGLASTGLLRDVPLLGALAPAQATVPDLSADIAALDQRLAALEAAEPAGSAGTDAISDLATRLSAVESALDDRPAPVGDGANDGENSTGLTARLDDLAQRLETLEQRPAATTGATPGAVSALDTRIDALETQVQSVDTIAKATSNRIDELETLVDGMNEKLAAASAEGQARAEQDRAARQLAVDALTAAYRRGEPFDKFLDLLGQMAGSSASVDALRDYATTGVATDAELIDGFDTASRQALGALAPEGESVVSRFLANARSLVDVRPAGPVEGDTPRAILSRVEAHLADGDYSAALAEWRTLPAEAQDAAADWTAKLERRAAADKALRGIGTVTGISGQ